SQKRELGSGFMTTKLKVLVVDDEIAVSAMMVFLLTRAGFDVEAARAGEKAMQMAEAGSFDLITLDVDLPDSNGFKLCSRFKEHPRLCDTPVVFISARCLIEDQQHGLEVGAVDYIIKPFDA